MIVTVTNPPTSELPVLRKVVRSSTIDLIVDQVRNAIYSGSLEPGQSINEVRTAELLEVSRPSLREALQRLISEGVMTHAPGRGVHVRRMRTADIDDVYAVREAIESQAVKLVIRHGRSCAALELTRGTRAPSARRYARQRCRPLTSPRSWHKPARAAYKPPYA